MDELETLRSVEGDQSCQSDGNSIQVDGRHGRMDDTKSSTHHNSKQLKMKRLAGEKGQDQQIKCDIMTDIPEASTPAPNPKRPIKQSNPPHCQG